MIRKYRKLLTAPVIVFPEPEASRPFHGIYPNGPHAQGMNPHYTGYIPGTSIRHNVHVASYTKDELAVLCKF